MLEQLWDALILVARSVAAHSGNLSRMGFSFGDKPGIMLHSESHSQGSNKTVWMYLSGEKDGFPADAAVAEFDSLYAVRFIQTGRLSPIELRFLETYLAYCFMPWHAHQWGRAVAISHFAQSLDGKIATVSGDSRWIGNESNLTHAHRMRALCGGIMIGTGTLQADKPSLTVRLVPGENPRRIIISSTAHDFSSLLESCPDEVLILGTEDRPGTDRLQYIKVPQDNPNGRISCDAILKCLYTQGIYSVYIEGGASTTSNFLRERRIDVLQLHLSPLIFGSGITGLSLPEIESVTEAVRFKNFHFLPIGDAYMFIGEPEGG